MTNDYLPSDDPHKRPTDTSDETVAAVGKLTEALERVERARGRLFDFHQLIGGADEQIAEAADLLAAAGHTDQADLLRRTLVGRNVMPGRWTFQLVEEFDDVYYSCVKSTEEQIRGELLDGRRHIYESELKEHNRTKGEPGHEARP